MKYAHYDETTQKLLGWYDDKLHKTIPEPNIEVEDINWENALKINANYVDLLTTKVISKDFRTEEEKISNGKSNTILIINNACRAEIINGFHSSVLVTDHLYQSEETDQLNLIGAVSSGIDQPFKCSADNGQTWEYKIHTNDQLKQVLQDGAAVKAAHLQKATQLKDSIAASSTVEQIAAITW